jgi:hypothetical protein
MSKMARVLAGVCIICASNSVFGEASIEAENLLLAPPRDFKIGYQSNHDRQSMTEWVPSQETVEDWSQMLTAQIFRGANVDAAGFLQGLGKRYMDACPGTTAKGIFTGKINGYVVSMLLLKCPNNPATGKPETTAFRVIKGRDALYSVQRAWRSVPSDQQVAKVMQGLSKVTVCDTRTPDHPCPSFESLIPQE